MSPYFLCSVNIHLEKDYKFNNLEIIYDTSEEPQDIHAEIPIVAKGNVNLILDHAFLTLQSVQAKRIALLMKDGSAEFHLDGQYDWLDPLAVQIESHVAPVVVRGSVPMDVTMKRSVAARAVCKGGGVNVIERPDDVVALVWSTDFNHTTAMQQSLSIIMRGNESPIYVIGRTLRESPEASHTGWAGNDQLSRPHLAPFAAAKVSQLTHSIDLSSSLPWIAILPITGIKTSNSGKWQIFSGTALLGGTIFHSIFSAGLLEPKIKLIPVHILGHSCHNAKLHYKGFSVLRSDQAMTSGDTNVDLFVHEDPPRIKESKVAWGAELLSDLEYLESAVLGKPEKDVKDDNTVGKYVRELLSPQTCLDGMKLTEFMVLWEALENVRTSSTVFVWEREATHEQTSYRLTSDAIYASTVSKSDRLGFIAATTINVCVAAFAGFHIVKSVFGTAHKVITIDMEEDDTVIAQQSHRTNHQLSSEPPVQWHINVAGIRKPNPGFRIRWTHNAQFERVCIAVHRVDDQWVSSETVAESTKSVAESEATSTPMSGSLRSYTTSTTTASDETASLVAEPAPAKGKSKTKSDDAVFVYLPMSAVRVVESLSGSQNEINIPLIAPPRSMCDFYPGLDVRQRWHLDSRSKYRLKLIALDSSNSVLTESCWSLELQAPIDIQVDTMLPFFLKRLFKTSETSWQLFARKCLRPLNVEIFPFKFAHFKLRVREGSLLRPGRQIRLIVRAFWDQSFPTHNDDGNTQFETCVSFERAASSPGDTSLFTYLDSDAYLLLDRQNGSQSGITFCVELAETGALLARGHLHLENTIREGFMDRHEEICAISMTVQMETLGQRGGGSIWGSLSGLIDATSLQRMINAWPRSPSDGKADVTLRHSDRLKTTADCIITNICPGQLLILGQSFEVVWKVQGGDTCTDKIHLSIIEPDEHRLLITLGPLPNTGRFHWTVHADHLIKVAIVKAQFAVTLDPWTDAKPASQAMGYSHSFWIFKPLLLSHLEYAYASFCRTLNLPMEHVTADFLQESGLSISHELIRVCVGLREALPFEPQVPLIHTKGQCIISRTTKLVTFRSVDAQLFRRDFLSPSEVFKSITKRVTILHSVTLDLDPFPWSQSHDCHFLLQTCLSGLSIPKSISTKLLKVKAKYARDKATLQTTYDNQIKSLWNWKISEVRFQRFIMFEAWTELLTLPWWLATFWLSQMPNVQIIGFFIVINAVYCTSLDVKHRDIDPRFISDLAFSLDPMSLIRAPYGLGIAMSLAMLDLFFKILGLIFFRSVERSWPEAAAALDRYYQRTLLVYTSMTNSVLPMILQWFIVTALIDTDRCLAIAMMAGTALYILYTTYARFKYSREYITDQLSKKMSSLLDVLLDAWFLSHDLIYMDDQVKEDETVDADYIVSLNKELTKLRSRASAYGERLFEELHTQAHVTIEEICSWKYSKVLPSSDVGFWYDRDGQAKGLEFEPSVPRGARFASVVDYQAHPDLFRSMLLGYETAMLADAVLHGPRQGFRLDIPPPANCHFGIALTGIPELPPPNLLSLPAKACLIFRVFDKDEDKRLKQIEFTLWASVLKKAIDFSAQWTALVDYMNATYRLNGSIVQGYTLNDLISYYTQAGEGEADHDYRHLFHVKTDDESENWRISRAESDEELAVNGLEDISDSDDSQKHETQLTDGPPKTVVSPDGTSADIAERLKTSESSRQLHFIFQHLTRHQTQASLSHMTQPSILARNYFKSHIQLLGPAFGTPYLLGHTPPTRDLHTLRKDTKNEASNALDSFDGGWTRLLALTYEDCFLRLAREISLAYSSIFDPNNVKKRLSFFFDKILAERIQSKVSRIVDSAVTVRPEDINEAKAGQLYRFPLKTCRHIQDILPFIWTSDEKTVHLSRLYFLMPTQTIELAVFVELCVYLGLIKKSETVEKGLKISPLPEPVTIRECVSPGMTDCLIQCLREARKKGRLGAGGNDGAADSGNAEYLVRKVLILVDSATRVLVSRYLPFPGFLFLVELTGIDLCEDEIPFMGRSIHAPRKVEGDGEPLDDGDEDFETWRNYLADVADIPSLKPKKMSAMTEEELAILERRGSPDITELEQSLMNVEHEGFNSLELQKLRTRRDRYSRNISKIRIVFNHISQRTGFMLSSLADEAIFMLLENRLGLAAARACLRYLNIDCPEPLVGHTIKACASLLPNPEEVTVAHLQETPDETDADDLDWRDYRDPTTWPSDLMEAYRKLTATTCGFIGKSQLFEFVGLVESKLISSDITHDETSGLRQTHWGPDDEHHDEVTNKHDSKDWRAVASMAVTPDAFHRVLIKLKLSPSREVSNIYWFLLCRELNRLEFEASLPAIQICGSLTRILFQPVTAKGEKYHGSSLGEIHSFEGCMPAFALVYLFRAIGLELEDQHLQAIWSDIPKDALNLFWCLGFDVVDASESDGESRSVSSVSSAEKSDESVSATKIDLEKKALLLRIGMDQDGLDPKKGYFINFANLRKSLAMILCTGLPPEGLGVFVRLACHLEIDQSRIDAVGDKYHLSRNRYGLFAPHTLVPLLCSLHVEGMSYDMLRSTILDDMRLNLKESHVRQLFDIMDVNQNRFLELEEILYGFEMLCKQSVPDVIINLLKLDARQQLKITALYFLLIVCFVSFLGSTVSSFAGKESGVGTSVQRLLAVAGAVAFRSQATASDVELDTKINNTLPQMFGDDFERRLLRVTRGAEVKSDSKAVSKSSRRGQWRFKIRYVLPFGSRPRVTDRKPCARFYLGQLVHLIPSVTNGAAKSDKLYWAIRPRLPASIGLRFDPATGEIRGKIEYSHETERQWSFRIDAFDLQAHETAHTFLTFKIERRILADNGDTQKGFWGKEINPLS